MLRSRLSRVVAVLSPVLAASLAAAPAARAEGTLISAPSRVDMAHDVARRRIYISSGSQLLRYDLDTKTLLTPLDIGGSLGGMDISPDGNTLAVANRSNANQIPGTAPSIEIDLVNLGTGVVTQARFPRASDETTAYSVAFEANGKLVVSTNGTYSWGGPLRLINLATNTSTNILPSGNLYGGAMVTASGNRSVVALAECGLSDGAWGRYLASDGSFVKRSGYDQGTSAFNWEIGVNASGTQFSIPTYRGTYFYDSSYQRIKQLGTYYSEHGIGVAYHPSRDLVFLPWASTSQIRVYNSSTFKQVGAYNFETTFDTSTEQSFQTGRTKVSSDGSLLMCNVPGGVRYVSLADLDSSSRPLAASGDNIELDEDSSVAFRLASTGGSLAAGPIYTILKSPTNGTLTGQSPNFTYTPRANFNGSDSLNFQVSRAGVTSTANVYFTIRPVNDAPVVTPKTVSTRQGEKIFFGVTATDVDDSYNSPLVTWSIPIAASHGTALVTTNGFSYAPEAGFVGTDTFQVVANDAISSGAPGLNSAPATITVNVLANSAPVAMADSYTRPYNAAFTIPAPGVLANDTDADGDTLSCMTDQYISVPYGNITLNANGSFSWTPPYTQPTVLPSSTSFTYRTTDALGPGNYATVTLQFTHPTTAIAQSVTVTEDTPKAITLTGTGDGPLTYAVTTQPTKGTLSGTAPNLTYTPYPNYYGTDSFIFSVSANGTTSTATVSITVSGVADLPIAYDQSIDTTRDAPVSMTLRAYDGDDNGFAWFIVSPPTQGTLSGTAPNLIYTPKADYVGNDSFTFKVNEGLYDSNVARVSIKVSAPVGVAPIAVADVYRLNRYNTLNVAAPGILANDTDADGDSLRAVLGTPPRYASNFVLNDNGSFTWTGFSFAWMGNYASDSFTYRVSDGTQLSAPVTVIIRQNDAPNIEQVQNYTTPEDTLKSIRLSASDPQANDLLTYDILTQPAHGSLAPAPNLPYLNYTPAANYFGTDSFTWRVSDGLLQSTVGTVNINVTAVNDAPSATSQTVSLDEDSSKSIVLAGSDIEGSSLTYSIIRQPAHGILSGTAPNLTYTPALDYFGTDLFSYKVNDGALDSNPAIVSLSIANVPDAPVASNQDVSLTEDTPKAITLSGTDVDGDALNYEVVNAPANGVLSGTAPNLTYTPNANFNGIDSFTYKVKDATNESAIATVSLEITAVNDVPSATDATLNVDEDSLKELTLAATDVDGDNLTFTVATQPTKGTLSGTVPNLTYTPNAGVTGTDAFTFEVSDGTLTATGTVSITINAVNDAPTATSQSVEAEEDTAKSIVLSGADADNDALTFAVVNAPTHGVLSGEAPNLTYTPSANYNGTDSFTFTTNDGTLTSEAATVTISVSSVNDAPKANAQSVSTDEETELPITLTGSDADGDTLTYNVTTQPAHGVLNGTAPRLSYIPDGNYNGADSFTFEVSDGTLSSTATISINVAAVSDAPIAVPDSYDATEDQPLTIAAPGVLGNDSDSDGDVLTALLTTNAAHGNVVLNANGGFTYTPDADYNGTDTFQYRARDAAIDSSAVTVTLRVAAVNDAPVALPQGVTTNEDNAKTIVLTGADAENSALTFTVVTQPTKGTLSGTAPNLIYTPNANANGSDSFTFKVSDGALSSANATVSIQINPVNDAPVATAQSVTTSEDTAKAITLSGNDIDGDALTYSIVSNPTKGTLSGTGANRTYTPNANYNGADSFTFKVNDGSLDSATVTVSIAVNAVNDAPVATNSSVTTLEDTAKAITLSATDLEGDALTYSIVTPPTKGILSGTGANLTYTPSANANGADSFTWKASDATLSGAATVSITITPVNDAPTATAQSVTTAQNTALPIVLSGVDVDGDALTYTIVTNPTKGTLSGTGANRTYTPSNNYNGADSFTFKVSDGTLTSSNATVSITVTPPVVVPKVEVTYIITSQTATTFSANVQIKNNGPATKNWTLVWTFAGNQRITSLTRGQFTQSGQKVTVNDANYNKSIATGATETISFQATYSGTNAKPTAFTLNGTATAVK